MSGSLKVGSLQPADFNIWINKAQRIVVDNKLASMDINTRHQDDLMPLRKKAVLTPVMRYMLNYR